MSIETEKQTLEQMIRLFCKAKHGSDSLCADCEELLDYAQARLDACPFGDDKPVCRNCEVHCYQPEMRQELQKSCASPDRWLFFFTAKQLHMPMTA